jgi:hypothetical protein
VVYDGLTARISKRKSIKSILTPLLRLQGWQTVGETGVGTSEATDLASLTLAPTGAYIYHPVICSAGAFYYLIICNKQIKKLNKLCTIIEIKILFVFIVIQPKIYPIIPVNIKSKILRLIEKLEKFVRKLNP